MATGDQGDLYARLAKFLPTRWFPAQAGTRIAATLQGAAAVLAQVWSQLQYGRAQTRLATSTDGWLDLFAFDYLGNRLPRLQGELDPVYAARVQQNLAPRGPTRPNMAAALDELTGKAPVIIEPWNPNDTGVLGGVKSYRQFWDEGVGSAASLQGQPLLGWGARLFLNVKGSTWQDLGSGTQKWDTAGETWDSGVSVGGGLYLGRYRSNMPGRLAARRPYQAYIDAGIPPSHPLGNAPVLGWGAGIFLGVKGSTWQDLAGREALGQQQVLDLIEATKVEGTVVWVRFGYLAPPPAPRPRPGFYFGANAYFDSPSFYDAA